ncbi:MAG: SDR family oxidoreductase [Patescibacteria group bacterium]
MDLKNKVVIITGGEGFLGQNFVQTFKEVGAQVVSWDITGQEPVDISDKKEVEKAIKKVMKKYGRVDVLINNAVLNPQVSKNLKAGDNFAPYEDYPLSLWENELKIGLTGSFLCAQAVIPAMKKQKSGVIINIGSMYGMIAPDNRIYKPGRYKSLGYATVKGAIPNFTRALASYLGPYGVRVNCFVPGGVYRDQDKDFVKKYSQKTMLGRMAKQDEYGKALLFMASSDSSYMTGATLVFDGGWGAW